MVGCDYLSIALSFDLNMILTKNSIANKINSEKNSEDCLNNIELSH